MQLKEAIQELKKSEKRKFDQSIDLIVNLRGLDLRKDNISTIISIPHKIKEKRVCGFLNTKSDLVTTITKLDFPKYKEKKDLKNLVKGYDFFIASAALMPSVATTFGKVLGPTGKMPSPQLGIVTTEDGATIKATLDKISKSVKIRLKESSVKISVGKQNMSDSDLEENIRAIYSGLISVLPVKKDNVKSVMIKLTMSKPVKVEM